MNTRERTTGVALLVVAIATIAQVRAAQPRAHGSQSLLLHIKAPARMTLEAFTPTQEARWNSGWDPVFTRPDQPNDEGSVFTTVAHSEQVIWLLDRYDRVHGEIRYVEVQPSRTLTSIDVVVTPSDSRHSLVHVSYERTSLSPQGDRDVARFMTHFSSQRAHWEQVLDEYLSAAASQ